MSSSIICEICEKGPGDGISIFRINEKGVPGIWRCWPHLPTNSPPDAAVVEIVNILEDR